MSVLKLVEGAGPTEDRAEEMAEAIRAIIYERGEGMSLAAVIGVLEIVKVEILEEHRA
jgi:hypothetical protein